MISVTHILIVGAILAFYYYFYKRDKRMDRYPPGPMGLPLLGHVLQMGSCPHEAFTKWSNKYGKILSIRFAMDKAVVIHDVKTLRDMFYEPVFSGRPQHELFLAIAGNYGVLNSEGRAWEEQRRFTLRHLRDFGFGKNAMELLINEEVREMIDWMKKEEGQPISVEKKSRLAVLNSLWTIISGKRFDQNDTTLNDLLHNANATFNDMSRNGLALFAPKLAKYIPEISGYNRIQCAFNDLVSFVEGQIKIHTEANHGDESINDFLQCYTNEINKTTDPSSTFFKEDGVNNMKSVVQDLFNAGAETTSHTLTWAILYLLREQEVQQKFHKEIDEVVGHARSSSLSDRPNMPYTEALIMEVLRYSSLTPLGVFHRALTDYEFNGFFIPKGTWLIPNLFSIHHDKEIWGDPENFRPERFLKNGKLGSKPDAFLPFLAGKRACLGETLARDSLFLFLTGIFQRFQILQDPTNPNPTKEPVVGFLLKAKPFNFIVKDRIAF